jgi:O-antigen/teichoic acid export membrane protein
VTPRLGLARVLDGHRWAAGPTLTSILASGLAAGTTLVIARGIGAAAFGQFNLVFSIAWIITVALLMSVNYVMLQELPRADPAHRPAAVTTALLSTLALGAALLAVGTLGAAPLASAIGVDTRTFGFALALALAMTLNQLTESFLRGLRRYAFTAGLKLAVAVVYLGVATYCALVLGIRDAEPYLIALIATNVVFAVISVAGFEVRPRSWSWRLARAMYRHGALITAFAVLHAVVLQADVIILNNWADRADVGVYSMYNAFPKRLLSIIFTDGIGLVLLPVLATADKGLVMRRIVRIAPIVAVATAVFSFAASTVFFLLMTEEYPYAVGLMALSAAGIGVYAVFTLYYVALSMDGIRGAKALITCFAVATPLVLACQLACIAWWGLIGGLVAFILGNLILVASVMIVSARLYPRKVLPHDTGLSDHSVLQRDQDPAAVPGIRTVPDPSPR